MFKYRISIEKTPTTDRPARAAKVQKPAKVKKHWSKKKKALTALLVLALLFGIGAYIFNRTLAGPAIGTVLSNMPAVTRKPQVELKQIDGAQYAFTLPVTFTEQVAKPGTSGGPNNLESRTFVSSEMITQVLVATVSKLPSGNIEDDPSYQLRKQDTAKYKLKSVVVKNEKVIIFTTNDSQQMQQSAFWAHGGKLLTLTLSGVATDIQATTAQFDNMVESIAWR